MSLTTTASPRRNSVGQFAHDAVFELGRGAGNGCRPHHQKPGGIARRRRPQRDPVVRQGEIEQVRAHAGQFPSGVKLHYNAHIATFGAAGNVTPDATSCAVIQVKPGIGDVIWHLPFIRAIAAVAPGGRVTFLAPPSSHAKELLAAEPAVAETIYFEHAGSELRRGINLIRLAALLRHRKFRSIWILDRTMRPALAARLAGIPERIGLGLGPQRLLITNPGIDRSHFHDQPIDWLRALMAAMKVPFLSTEPDLHLPDATLADVAERFKACVRPWIALGIGASHPDKDWPDQHWAEFVTLLRSRVDGTVFLVGGTANFARAQNFIAGTSAAAAVNACDLGLVEAAALLRHADLFIGPSSGPMNLAVACGTDAFGLFGSTPVLTYSKFIHPVEPPGGQSPDGMRRISPAQVLERVAPYLSRQTAQTIDAGNLLRVGRHLHLDDAVGIGRRLAALELVHHVHAGDHFADHGILAVEEIAVVEHDEELAVGGVGIARRAPCRRCRARTACRRIPPSGPDKTSRRCRCRARRRRSAP